MNLFLLNSIHSLILMIFMGIFFFLLDGINTFEFINIQERITQMIWCSFFVIQVMILKVAEVFSKNRGGKQLFCIHYLLIVYTVLLPLLSALLFTSALSWTKLVYFTYILGLTTSIKIRGLLSICAAALITGFIRIYYSFPTWTIIFYFTLLLAVHMLICVIFHASVYILAKEIAHIKKKPLCALDNIEPYFHELEKKAILIRNNLIYCQQNKISVDILGNNLFECEVKDGIKKIKTVNKIGTKLDAYGDEVGNVKYETPYDVSDVNSTSDNSLRLEIGKGSFQDEGNSSFSKKDVGNGDMPHPGMKINDEIGRRVKDCIKKDKHRKEAKGRIPSCGINRNNVNESSRNHCRSEDTDGAFSGDLHSDRMNTGQVHPSRWGARPISKGRSRSIKHHSLEKFNNKIVKKKLDTINVKDYRETYKKEIFQKHFSLLRSGLVKFNRKRNILLSEELKNKINYIYFDRNGNVKQSKIIPLYVLERHNLNDISTYLRNDIHVRNENYYETFTIFSDVSGLISPHEDGLGHEEREKGDPRDGKKKVDVITSDLIRPLEKRRITSYHFDTYSSREYNRRENLSEAINKRGRNSNTSVRVFYVINSTMVENDGKTCDQFHPNDKKEKTNEFHNFMSTHDVNISFGKNNSKLCVSKFGERKKNILHSEYSSGNISSYDNAFYVDDVLGYSFDSISRQGDSENDVSTCSMSSSNGSFHKEDPKKRVDKISIKKKILCIRNRTEKCNTMGDMGKGLRHCMSCRKGKSFLPEDESNMSSYLHSSDSYGEKDNLFGNASKRGNGVNGGDVANKRLQSKQGDRYHFTKCPKRSGKNSGKGRSDLFTSNPSEIKKNESDRMSKKKFFLTFQDIIPLNCWEKPERDSEKVRFCYRLKKCVWSLNSVSIIFGKILTFLQKIQGKDKYWKRYNNIMNTSEWKRSMQDNELEYILNYRSFTKWYNYWVKTLLYNYYKSTYVLNILLALFNVLLVYIQIYIFYYLFRNNNPEIISPNPFYTGKPLLLKNKYNLNNFIDENIFTRFVYMRIPAQLITNMIFILPSILAKNGKSVKLLHIFATLNCMTNIFFGMVDISYSLNSRIYNVDELYDFLNYYNIFDIFLIGKLITSIFLIPFFTNFNGDRTCYLVYFSCFSYIATFYYTFTPLSFSVKLMFITNFSLLIAAAASTAYFSR
ncbi:conserved Plasmodium protein, unknown function [Plasmodium ovale]|uniref:Uncharacterized protein n=1 Tax=Plasmodium ovale TaxID=36330 RepID=A0A1C3KQR8_PLAOA|nr:conserved Plasmodium protein, unknown function [Plasmodium ovale]